MFKEFSDSVDMAYAIKDVKIWTTICTKNLVTEQEARSSAKRLSKDLAQTDYRSYKENFMEKVHIPPENKLAKFNLRLKYWDYFRIGQEKLLSYMHYFNEGAGELETQIGDPRVTRIKKKVDDKIKRYILSLEERVEKNLLDIQRMKKKLDEYETEQKQLKVSKQAKKLDFE